ncbi:MAG: hypothetical protein QOK83_09390 [Nitrososphaeraceae archaeon]|jgi:hypothetical protein|nr:hypothetical protein [Nitrososphaeraceae archaeon]
MSDLIMMYGIATGAFVIFTGILFGARTKRINKLVQKSREEKQVT